MIIPNVERLVVVEWDDAWSEAGNAENIPKAEPSRVFTVGIVVVENEEGILLTQSWGKDGFGAFWFIPNGMILDVRGVVPGDPK